VSLYQKEAKLTEQAVETLEEVCFWKCLYSNCRALTSGPAGITVEADAVCDGKNKECKNYCSNTEIPEEITAYHRNLRISA